MIALSERIDIHDFNSRLASAKKLVKLANLISEKNSAIISKFESYGISEGPSKARVTKYVYTLRKIAEMLDKNFDEATRTDMEQLVNELEQSDYSAWTKHDY